MAIYATSILPTDPQADTVIDTPMGAQENTSSIWHALDEIARKKSRIEIPVGPNQDFKKQLAAYLQEPTLQRKQDPLAFWRDVRGSYPLIKRLARLILCIPSTAVPSERVWSDAGNIVTGARQRLTPANMRMLLYLRENCNTNM
jgi:hypothetical protein